jgi:transposase InsO family protein
LDTFKSFKSEIELQLNKRIKSVRSDRGGEYYGRSDGSGEQRPGPFAKFLEDNEIVPRYTMSGSSAMNGVAEKRNRTLIEMVQSMISHTSLSLNLWGEALKTTIHILNWIPTRQQIKLQMSYGLDENLVSNILEFGFVRLKLGLMNHKRRSWMKGLLAAILSDM